MTSKSIDQLCFREPSEIPEEFQFETFNQTKYLIGGVLHQWDGPFQEVISPICIKKPDGTIDRKIGSYPLLTKDEAHLALEAAAKAYAKGSGKWPAMTVRERIKHVEAFVESMKPKRAEIVRLLMWEIGKSLPDSEKEFDRTVEYIVDTIEALKVIDRTSSRFEIVSGIAAQVRRAPLGVTLCMGPFNYPLNETFTTLIPALIMGNTIIFKPPKSGVLLHEPLLEAFRDSFPEGVVNTVYGDGQTVIQPLMESGKIDVLAFIGSSKVAGILKKQHPFPHRLRCVLGLEAKNAGIVLGDTDIDLAVKECLAGALSFNGQRCTALKILFIHKSIAKRFLELFCQSVEQLSAGMPWEQNATITPLPEPGKAEYLDSLVKDAIENGATIFNKGGGDFVESLFLPAILYPVNSSMRVYREEQFGPVVPIVPFDDIEEPIQYVVNSPYGQQVSIFGRDPVTMAKIIDQMVNQVCRVNVNSQCQRGPDSFPFTGRKDSAEGTLSVSDALKVFSIRTLVAAKLNSSNKELLTRITRDGNSTFLSTDFLF